ncbi:fibronectin type III domain-containing protein [Myroides odoratimimus]|uniref:fibronectin type III domain-containing protein n=1 Tax=Myroides odoratimimus TaxID=76832 RepID=UPI002574E42C|nr:fibronectin type III domain-containing protein [Myroides odoratimimus]MDM1396059.1 fibronectin type III domain-containing protein [Myroides odoratimimus]
MAAVYNHNFAKTPIRFHKSKESWPKTNTLKYNTDKIYLQVEVPAGNLQFDIKVYDNKNVIIDSLQTSHQVVSHNEKLFLVIELLNEAFYKGLCYVEVKGSDDFYLVSDPFCFISKYDHQNKIVYSSKGSAGDLVYIKGSFNEVNIPADVVILLGESNMEQETVEDGYGEEKAIQKKLIQKYTFSCFMPNHIAEAMSIIPMHESIVFYINDEVIQASNVEVGFESDQLGFNSLVMFAFEVNRNIEAGCNDDVTTVLVKSPFVFSNNIQDNSIQVIFNESKAALGMKGYFIGIKKNSEEQWSDKWLEAIKDNDMYEYDFTELAKNQIYEIRVKAVDTMDNESVYQHLTLKTKPF